jgi:hypothetical protein
MWRAKEDVWHRLAAEKFDHDDIRDQVYLLTQMLSKASHKFLMCSGVTKSIV